MAICEELIFDNLLLMHVGCIDGANEKIYSRQEKPFGELCGKKTFFKLSEHGVVAGVTATPCWFSGAGDLSCLGCLCGFIFRMPSRLEPFDTQVCVGNTKY